ncbi:MAG TPA: transcription antitermination factor NusB [Candidatus Cloacimonas sp.]|jgi:N utilization substance protein B|nr:transcription antitermination protein NusB [Candidatus Cloacimonadota bacterium]HCX73348.1 transcription antitermination factor NusB [Candidatus Cloacimonas sp.]
MGLRRKGREIALQTLYSLEYLETDSYLKELGWLEKYKEKMAEICEDNHIETDSKICEFAASIIEGIIPNLDVIDENIGSHSTNWSIDKIANLDKCLLRIATYEMLFTQTPPPIVMDEAIEIAKKFCAESSSKFINGILNAIAKEKDE